jgi:hypothetical protein
MWKAFIKTSGITRFLSTACLLSFLWLSPQAQEIVDKTVAVVSDGNRSELITYSDLLWQLALQSGSPPLNPPRSEDLDQALQTLVNQRIFALEAQRLPREAPSKEEIVKKIKETVDALGPPAAFQARLRQVGFDSVNDPAFEELIARRLSIEKYVDFRFGSFVVVTADDVSRYYREVFVPEFRRRTPGLLLPTLDDSRAEIRDVLTRQKIATAIESFLDDARRRVNVEMLIKP